MTEFGLLQEKKAVFNDARELLKRAVDAGCPGSELKYLSSFIEELGSAIYFLESRDEYSRQDQGFVADTPQGDPPD